jgi:hypothetical protein
VEFNNKKTIINFINIIYLILPEFIIAWRVGKKAAGFKPEFWNIIREFRNIYNRKKTILDSI